MSEALVVFTIEPPETILAQGGSQEWKIQPGRAERCDFLVCVQNRNGVGRDDWAWCEPTEPNKAAFLIGHIDDVVPADTPGRFRIKIQDYARIYVPAVWQGWRFPVRYMTLSDLGIDVAALDFQPIPEPSEGGPSATTVVAQPTLRPGAVNGGAAASVRPLSLSEAKLGLAATFGVSPDAIEITIRG